MRLIYVLPLILVILIMGCVSSGTQGNFTKNLSQSNISEKAQESKLDIKFEVKNAYKVFNLTPTKFAGPYTTYLVINLSVDNPFKEYFIWPYLKDSFYQDEYLPLEVNLSDLLLVSNLSAGNYTGNLIFEVLSNDTTNYTLFIGAPYFLKNYSIEKIPEPSKTEGLYGKLTLDSINYSIDCDAYCTAYHTYNGLPAGGGVYLCNNISDPNVTIIEPLKLIRWIVNYTIENNGSVPFTMDEDTTGLMQLYGHGLPQNYIDSFWTEPMLRLSDNYTARNYMLPTQVKEHSSIIYSYINGTNYNVTLKLTLATGSLMNDYNVVLYEQKNFLIHNLDLNCNTN